VRNRHPPHTRPHLFPIEGHLAANRIRSQKLRFLADLVVSSLFTPMRGSTQPLVRAAVGQLGVTFIGHSSFLLQIAGLAILVDPVFAHYLYILKRRRKPGLRVADLPPIDAVLLTHAHMDHLNLPSLRRIIRHSRRLGRTAPVAVVPRGVEDLVTNLGFSQIIPLEWWQATELHSLSTPSAPVHLTMTPARHWGARMFSDTHRGFGGYLLAGAGHRLYHSGDTAYFEGFTQIGRKLHPQVALLPIGAYFPDNFRGVHTSPEDALQAFLDLGAQTMIPMHYGTFRLSLEPMDEPVPRLLAAAQQAGIRDRMLPLSEGETRLFPARS
jgi:L-ascorbate metabolism protein UlaG (beta-lactamase superfamily)